MELDPMLRKSAEKMVSGMKKRGWKPKDKDDEENMIKKMHKNMHNIKHKKKSVKEAIGSIGSILDPIVADLKKRGIPINRTEYINAATKNIKKYISSNVTESENKQANRKGGNIMSKAADFNEQFEEIFEEFPPVDEKKKKVKEQDVDDKGKDKEGDDKDNDDDDDKEKEKEKEECDKK